MAKEPMPIIIGITLANSRTCDNRCYYAKSSKCSCVCEGINHGIECERTISEQQSIQIDGTLRFVGRDEYYKNKLRQLSRKIDFGAWWRDGRNYPTYCVTWVEDTGELYAIDQYKEKIEVLGKIMNEVELEKKLEGWTNICGLMNSLQWVRDKVAR